jgi:hypothetical protein
LLINKTRSTMDTKIKHFFLYVRSCYKRANRGALARGTPPERITTPPDAKKINASLTTATTTNS